MTTIRLSHAEVDALVQLVRTSPSPNDVLNGILQQLIEAQMALNKTGYSSSITCVDPVGSTREPSPSTTHLAPGADDAVGDAPANPAPYLAPGPRLPSPAYMSRSSSPLSSLSSDNPTDDARNPEESPGPPDLEEPHTWEAPSDAPSPADGSDEDYEPPLSGTGKRKRSHSEIDVRGTSGLGRGGKTGRGKGNWETQGSGRGAGGGNGHRRGRRGARKDKGAEGSGDEPNNDNGPLNNDPMVALWPLCRRGSVALIPVSADALTPVRAVQRDNALAFLASLSRVNQPHFRHRLNAFFSKSHFATHVLWQSSVADSPTPPSVTISECVGTLRELHGCYKSSALITWKAWMAKLALHSIISRAIRDAGGGTVASFYNSVAAQYRSTDVDLFGVVDVHTFQKWNHLGTTIARLASAGSIHILLLILGLDMVDRFRNLDHQSVEEIAGALAAPHELPENNPRQIQTKQCLTDYIIPAILLLRQAIPINVFGLTFGNDINEEDRWFSNLFVMNSLKIVHDPALWNSSNELHRMTTHNLLLNDSFTCTTASTSQSPRERGTHSTANPVNIPVLVHSVFRSTWRPARHRKRHVIHTSFKLPERATNIVPRDKDELYIWTEKQRLTADTARSYTTVTDAEMELTGAYNGQGERLDACKYVRLQPLADEDLVIVDGNDRIILHVLAQRSTPSDYMAQLWDALANICGAQITSLTTPFNTRAQRLFMYALHLCVWNKYCATAPAAPPGVKFDDIDPTVLNHPRRFPVHNPAQLSPHYSADIVEDTERYKLLVELLEPLFSHVVDTLEVMMPDIYNELSQLIRNVPLHLPLPCCPLTGFVINILACCLAHQDDADVGICGVAVFGREFTGGDFCIAEAGIRLKADIGTVFFLPSDRLTHFNMHFEGLRGSIVMQTDRGWLRWQRGNAGPQSNDSLGLVRHYQ